MGVAHTGFYDFVTRWFSCSTCGLQAPDGTFAELWERFVLLDHLDSVVAASARYPRGRLELARIERVEKLYRAGLAEVER